ncbi:MAG: DUF4173 domain-containing protein, partial [Bacteroidales bacterium]|nr:DUF4173 domain-containing protein [Bacteroidales bacterium]
AFTFLFFQQEIGLNLLIFELLLFFAARKIHGCFVQNKYAKVLMALVFSSLLAVIFVNSVLAITVNIIFLLLFAGWLAQQQTSNFMWAALNVFKNIFVAPLLGLYTLFKTTNNPKSKVAKALQIIVFGLVIFMLIALFSAVYSSASPWFGEKVEVILEQFFSWVENIHIQWLPTFTLGVVLSAIFLFSKADGTLAELDKQEDDIGIQRTEKQSLIYRNGLVVLVLFLNLLLLAVNWLDLKNVWLFFEWNGDFLKQFVHEGTYMLLFSVALAALVMLIIFSSSAQNIQNDQILSGLSYLWIAQNVFLVLSVGMRNYWYMSYFALAYKRIAVVFVLILLLAGLTLLFLKIKKQKSLFWLIRHNALALFLVLGIAALPNWDAIIARYNLSHYQKSFVHFDFLVQLTGKTLPILDLSQAELAAIEQAQQRLFFLEADFMPADEFQKRIQKRKEKFIEQVENRSFLSWNYADFRAVKKLSSSSDAHLPMD